MASAKEYQTTKKAFDNATMFSKDLTECDRLSIEYLKPLAGGSILSIGCGYGNIIEQLPGEQHAIDISEKMLEHCDIVYKQLGNMDSILYPDNTFDLVYMVMTLQHSLNPEKTLDEATRVLREGCPLIIIDGDKNSAIGQQRENDPNWEKCGDAKWFTEQYFTDMGFEVTHLAPHIMAAKILKDSWTMEHSAIKIITDYIKKNKPKVVVELGSGKSTDKLKGLSYEYFSFENNSHYYRLNAENITYTSIYSNYGDWYNIEDFPPKIDLLIIDGPAGTTPMARKPAEQLFSRTKVAFLHDTARSDEKKMLKEWGKKHKVTNYPTLYGLAKIEIK